MSTRQTLLVAMVSLGAFFASAVGAQELNAPKAAAETQAGEKPSALFDAKNLTFVFGPKKIIFGQDGTLTMMSDSRKIGFFYFSVGTDYNDYQTNQVKKITPEYPGGALCVTGCDVDETAKTITIKGLIPFHKSDSAKRILYPWTETATLLPDGKVDVKIVIDAPEDTLKFGKAGIFFELSNTRDYTARNYSSAEFPTCPDGSSMPWRFPVITVDTEMPGDSFAVEVLKNSILQPKTKKPSIYLTPTGQSWNFVLVPLRPAN